MKSWRHGYITNWIWAAALLETSPLGEELHVPGATICSEWTTRCRVGWQIQIGFGAAWAGGVPVEAALA